MALVFYVGYGFSKRKIREKLKFKEQKDRGDAEMQATCFHFNRKLYLDFKVAKTVPQSSPAAIRNRLQLGQLTVCHGRCDGNRQRAN